MNYEFLDRRPPRDSIYLYIWKSRTTFAGTKQSDFMITATITYSRNKTVIRLLLFFMRRLGALITVEE